MKNRVIFGIIGALFALGSLFFIFVPVYLGVIITIFSLLAVYEIEKVSNISNVPLMVVSLTAAGLVPWIYEYKLLERINMPVSIAVTIYVMLLLVIMLAFYSTTRFEHVTVAFFASMVIPFAFNCFVMVRDMYETVPDVFISESRSMYLMLFGLFCTFLTDTFALFVGIKFGKHKMAPKISPKKSVEGAVGGIVCTAAFNAALWLVFDKFIFDGDSLFPLWLAVLLSAVLSALSMLGDLSASVIKRNNGVKDFGYIMPGHGGIMDRFDSFCFVFPSLYIFLCAYAGIIG